MHQRGWRERRPSPDRQTERFPVPPSALQHLSVTFLLVFVPNFSCSKMKQAWGYFHPKETHRHQSLLSPSPPSLPGPRSFPLCLLQDEKKRPLIVLIIQSPTSQMGSQPVRWQSFTSRSGSARSCRGQGRELQHRKRLQNNSLR